MADDLRPKPQVPAPRRFTRTEFDLMVAQGLFAEGERVELIGGEIVSVMGEGYPHADGVNLLFLALQASLPQGLVALQRTRLDLPDETEVYPDILVCEAGVRTKDLSAANVRLLVEASDSTLKFDREVKAARYAAAGFAEYWVFDVGARRLWIYRRPSSGEWASIEKIEGEARAAPLFAPQAAIVLPRVEGDDA